MALIKLRSKEIARLEEVVMTTADAKQLKRAQALLWLTQGDTVEEVAERLSVTRQTIYNWIERFERRADLSIEERLSDGARSGRPPTALEIIDPLIEEVIDQDPRDFGYRSTLWTADLLRQYIKDKHQIEVCSKSVSLAIDRLRICWKRPRHSLTLKAKNWQRVKGGSNTACGHSREQSC